MHPEQQYLDLLRRIRDEGCYRPSPHQPVPGQPSPPGTYSLINQNMAFDLADGFPLLTTRATRFDYIVCELLWYLSGSTRNQDLKAIGDIGTPVWDAWDTEHTNRQEGWVEGEFGPIYGKQWRHFGADMIKPDGELAGRGYDQIMAMVDGLKANPNSKRLFVTAYDPIDRDKCFVTTCHGLFFCQVMDGRLHLHMVQRSGDVPIGIPFNIACYSLLLLMLAQVAGLEPGIFHHTISDAHIYENQVEPMQRLFEREPLPLARVELNKTVTDILAFTFDDVELVGYQAHPWFRIPVST